MTRYHLTHRNPSTIYLYLCATLPLIYLPLPALPRRCIPGTDMYSHSPLLADPSGATPLLAALSLLVPIPTPYSETALRTVSPTVYTRSSQWFRVELSIPPYSLHRSQHRGTTAHNWRSANVSPRPVVCASRAHSPGASRSLCTPCTALSTTVHHCALALWLP
jgi:hypothetical protein